MATRGVLHVLAAIAFTLSAARDSSAHARGEILHSFTGGKDGGEPDSGLTVDAAGNLYGTTVLGGQNDGGVAYEFSITPDGTWKETVLHNFCTVDDCSDGNGPGGGLVFDASGNLYGTTFKGGQRHGGVVFELSPIGKGEWKETTLFQFDELSEGGWGPEASVTFDDAGHLYGTTFWGGDLQCEPPNGCGVVFELVRGADGTWAETVLHAFSGGEDGANPLAPVTLDAAGNLYGTASQGGDANCGNPVGCGAVFELSSSNGKWTETTLHTFSGGRDGANPDAGLVLDAEGDLFGTAVNGGDLTCVRSEAGCGVVFELIPGAEGWTERSFSFGGKDGANPNGIVFDSAGNLYGTTRSGGGGSCEGGCGVVFSLTKTPDGWVEHYFPSLSSRSGVYSEAGVAIDSFGNLYGTTAGGGAHDQGELFEIYALSHDSERHGQ